MDSVFSTSGYRVFLRRWIDAQPSAHGLKSKIATAVGCQNSQLTLVLREEVHFTPDQVFELCEFLKFTEAETAFFQKMVEHDRSGNSRYRKKLKEQMQQMKLAHENLANRFKEKGLDRSEETTLYYSSWHWSAVHVATMIPRLQTPSAIAGRLHLDEPLVRTTLEKLEGMGLVRKEGERWKPTHQFLHLGRNSTMSSVQHGNWRNRAVLKSQDASGNDVHYTMVQCISEEDYEKIKQIVLDAIDRYRKIADPSREEDIVCFACDFFRI